MKYRTQFIVILIVLFTMQLLVGCAGDSNDVFVPETTQVQSDENNQVISQEPDLIIDDPILIDDISYSDMPFEP